MFAANNTGYMQTGNSRQQNVGQNTRQGPSGVDLYKASTQQREEIRELMGQIDMPDDSLTMSSLSQSPWNIKSRQRMSQTHGTQDNDNDNDGTLGRSEYLDGTTYNEENKSLSITRRQNQTSYIDDVDDSQNNQTQQDEYDNDSQMIIDQDQSQSDIDHSRLQNFKRKIHNNSNSNSSPLQDEHLEDSQIERGRNSPDFNRGLEDSQGVVDDLTISQTVISNTNTTTTYRGAPAQMLMTENQNTRRVQNRTFADSVMNQGYNQLTSSSNNNTYRNNYSSNQETHRNHNISKVNTRHNDNSRVSNKNKTHTQQFGGKQHNRKNNRRRRNQQDDGQNIANNTSDDNMMNRSDDLDESESEDINRRIQEQSDDDEDEDYNDEVSPPPNDRRRNRSSNHNNQNTNISHTRRQDDLDSSEFSNVDSFTQTQYSKWSRLGKSKMFKQVKGDDIDLTEDDNASIIKMKSPMVQRFRNMANEEALSLTPVSVEGKWQNQKSILGGHTNKAINRTMAQQQQQQQQNDLQNPLNKLSTNLMLNQNNLNMTADHGNIGIGSRASYNATQVLFGNNKHHTSIQRDQELEQALEEDSQNQSLNKTTLTNSAGTNKDPPLRQSQYQQQSQQIDFRKVKYENTQLQIDLRKAQVNVKDLAEQLEQCDMQREQMRDIIGDMEFQYNDVKEHLMLLKQKCQDESQLPILRGRLLEQARVEIKNLTKTLEKKDNHIQQLEKLLQEQDKEDKINYAVFNEEIQKLVKEIETQKILNESLKKEVKLSKDEISKSKTQHHQLRQDNQKDQLKLKQEYDQWLQQIQQEYDSKLQQQTLITSDLQKQLKAIEKQLRQQNKQIEDDQGVIDQKDQIIAQMERDYEKITVELGGFRERCKDLETELEHIRGGADGNSMMFGNQSMLYGGQKVNTTLSGGLNQTRINNYDFEVKKMKDVFTQQLNKAKEESTKYRQQAKDFEQKVKALEEEQSRKYQQSITQTSEQIEKDQKMINELQKVNQKLNQHIQLDADIRELFNISHTEDLYNKLLVIREDQEMKVLLENELSKLQQQLKEAQQRELELIEGQNKLIQSQQKQNKTNTQEGGMSNFTKTLLMNKDIEIDNLRQQIERERQNKQDLDDQLWKQQNELKSLQLNNQEMEVTIQELQRELTKVKESKDKSEKNVDELKEKLRIMIREQQEQQQLQQPNKKDTYLDDIERRKYEDLITMILELDLATDPLHQVNLSLQESFIDEYEQATKHLEEQKRLVQVMQQKMEKDFQNKQEQYKNLQDELKQHQSTIESQKREIFRIQDQVKDKEREIEVIITEQEELHKTCERLNNQLREVEEYNNRLRADNEEVNLNFRKLMRAQDYLHKANNNNNDKLKNNNKNNSLLESSILTINENKNEQQTKNQLQENSERINMIYEDQLSKYYRVICNQQVKLLLQSQQISNNNNNNNNKNQQENKDISPQNIRDQYKLEILDILDQLIDNKNTKQLTFNDMGMKLAQRIDKIRQQERIKYQQQQLNNYDSNDNNNLQLSQNMSGQQQQQNLNNKSISQIVENFKQEIDGVHNENELLSSINKWFKSSGANFNQQQMQQQQNLFRNFFTNDDQNSLMLSELISNNNNNNNNNKQLQQQEQIQQQQFQPSDNNLQSIREKDEIIKNLQQKLEQLEQQQEQKQQEIENLNIIIKQLQVELKQKEQSFKDQEQQYQQQLESIDSDQKSKTQSLWKEVENLKNQIQQELQQKSEQLDLEYEELEKQKLKNKQQLLEQQKEQEKIFQMQLENQEKEFRDKLKLIETDIKSGCEKSKEEQITNLCKQLEEQYQIRLKTQADEHQQQIQITKSEYNSKIEEIKRQKDRDSKKNKEEQEKLKKTYEDKIKKIEQEHITEKEYWEREHKEKLDQIIQKNKKDIKTAQDKIRAEMRNQVDAVKNDMVKQKAEMEREKKKIQQEHDNGIEQLKRDFEEQLDKDLKNQKDKSDKLLKKKLEEKTQENQRKSEELENEIQLIRENHNTELKKERERIENRLKEQIRGDVRLEVHDELEIEFKEQLEKMKQQQQIEIDKIKSKFEVILREERASMMPSQEMPQYIKKQNVEVQCELMIDQQENILDIIRPSSIQNTNVNNRYQQNSNLKQQYSTNLYQTSYINTSLNSNNINNRVNDQVNQSQQSNLINNSLYIEQLKHNFEEELERQQQLFEVQLVNKQNVSVKVFEELMVLEFDKILQSIYFKSNQQGNTNQQELDKKRNNINKLIADILSRNDDRKEKQMRNSLENLKKKISEVLKIFKQELENKLNKKQDQLIKEQVLKERLKIQNLSEIISVSQREGSQQEDNLLTGRSDIVRQQQQHNFSDIQSDSYNYQQHRSSQDDFRSDYYQDSRPNSQLPTPRNLDILNNQVEQRSNNQHQASSADDRKPQNQLSDIKKYSQQEQQDNNILKKISPVVNQNGVLVVEVDKVVRDLKMLQQTIKIAKFFRVLLSVDENKSDDSKTSQDSGIIQSKEGLLQQQVDNETTLQQYRVLLNDLFKLIAKMNQGAELMGKQSEVYKLKLLNAELRDKITKLENEGQINSASMQVEEILNTFQKNMNLINESTVKCLNILENTQFSINKLQLKLFQLIDMFTDDQGQIQSNLELVEEKCQQYLEQNPNDQVQLLQSTITPDKQQKNICPEMLSPEETAKLVANVFQRLNQTTSPAGFNTQLMSTNNNNINIQGATGNHPLDTYQSFFNTFLSNDEYVKSAENFIKKYREQMNFTQQQQKNNRMLNRTNTGIAHNLPLQVTSSQENIGLRLNNNMTSGSLGNHRQYQSVQITNLNNQKRSRSQSNKGQNHNQSAFTSHPYYNMNSNYVPQQQQLNQTNVLSNPSQTYVSNIFQKGCSDQYSNNNMHSISIHTQNPSLIQQHNQYPQNENVNYMNIQQHNQSHSNFGMMHHSYSNNNIIQSANNNQSINNNTNMFTRTAGGMSAVSQSYNGNPWKQQQQHSLNNPMLINNQNSTIQTNINHRSQTRQGSIAANRSVDEVSQAQNSVNALFEKLKTNYQHTQGNLNATKNQSFN